MVRAILKGQKSVTRRVVRPQPATRPSAAGSPYGCRGDRLWVKETYWAFGEWTVSTGTGGKTRWTFNDRTEPSGEAYQYAAELPDVAAPKRRAGLTTWWRRPALFMPRRVSRLTLEIEDVTIDRIHDVSEREVAEEGIVAASTTPGAALAAWRDLWIRINGEASWVENPWVWAIRFHVLDDQRG
jgi:hypothetical protein